MITTRADPIYALSIWRELDISYGFVEVEVVQDDISAEIYEQGAAVYHIGQDIEY